MPYPTAFIAQASVQCPSLHKPLKYTKLNNKIHKEQHKTQFTNNETIK